MSIVVTGANGFIGESLCHNLEGKGRNVMRQVRSAERGASEEEGFRIPFDIDDPPENSFELLKEPETLVHLAWSGLGDYRSTSHFEDELPKHYQFLKSLVESGIKRLVVTGTCFEYGLVEGCLDEEMIPNPQNPYGFAKDALRRELEFLQLKHDFELIWCRLFYLQGARQAERSLFGQLDAAIERGDESFPMSKGEQLRDYLRIEEATEIIGTLSIAPPESGSQIYNVCSGVPRSIRSLVEEYLSERGVRMELELGHYPYSDLEPFAFWGSRVRLDRALGIAG
ncbi:MAG: NAD-dependent epimerase/dehydratase family protein [Verrucomicrobiota bacterium]